MKELAILSHSSLDSMVEESIKNKEEFFTVKVISECMLNRTTDTWLIDYVLDWYNYYRNTALDKTMSKYQAIWKGIEEISQEYQK